MNNEDAFDEFMLDDLEIFDVDPVIPFQASAQRYRLRRRCSGPLFTPSLLQEYIEKLRWVDKFVRDEVEPLDQLNFSPCEPRYSRRPGL